MIKENVQNVRLVSQHMLLHALALFERVPHSLKNTRYSSNSLESISYPFSQIIHIVY